MTNDPHNPNSDPYGEKGRLADAIAASDKRDTERAAAKTVNKPAHDSLREAFQSVVQARTQVRATHNRTELNEAEQVDVAKRAFSMLDPALPREVLVKARQTIATLAQDTSDDLGKASFAAASAAQSLSTEVPQTWQTPTADDDMSTADVLAAMPRA
jgi:hypothetical protein